VEQFVIVAVTGFAIGIGYRYFWDDPSDARVANYLRSGLHAFAVSGSGDFSAI
jgi:hypothetical protein